jgi:hypothetical protein
MSLSSKSRKEKIVSWSNLWASRSPALLLTEPSLVRIKSFGVKKMYSAEMKCSKRLKENLNLSNSVWNCASLEFRSFSNSRANGVLIYIGRGFATNALARLVGIGGKSSNRKDTESMLLLHK